MVVDPRDLIAKQPKAGAFQKETYQLLVYNNTLCNVQQHRAQPKIAVAAQQPSHHEEGPISPSRLTPSSGLAEDLPP